MRIIVDSGCPQFIHPFAHDVQNMRPTNESYKGAAKSSEVCPCIGIGDMPVFVDDGEKTFFHVFQNVRVVPGFGYTLASVQQFEDEGFETIFGAK